MISFALKNRGWILIYVLLAVIGGAVMAFLPWETAGAPVFLILLSGSIAFALVLRDSSVEERRFVIRLFLVALAVRVLAAVLYYWLGAGIPNLVYKDAVGYDRAAWAVATAWRQGTSPAAGLGPLVWLKNDAYTNLLAVLYYGIGRTPAAAIAINAVLGAASIYLVYRISAILFGQVTARWAAWFTAFFSGLWLWGMMVMKDAVFLFLVLLFFLALYRCWYLFSLPDLSRRRMLRAAGWAVVLVAAWISAGAFRGYARPVLALAAALLPAIGFLRADRIWRWLAAFGAAAALLVIFLPQIVSYPLPPVALGTQSQLFQWTVVPETGTVGSFIGWIVGHPADFARYLMLTMSSTVLAPYAWILPGSLPEVPRLEPYMMSYPGMALWYVILPFAVLGLYPAIRRSKGDSIPLIFFAAALFLVVSVFVPREYRHRDMIMPVALILAAEGFIFSRRWWALGLFFWLPLVGVIAWKLHSLWPILLAGIAALNGAIIWWNRGRNRRDAPLVERNVR